MIYIMCCNVGFPGTGTPDIMITVIINELHTVKPTSSLKPVGLRVRTVSKRHLGSSMFTATLNLVSRVTIP